MSKELIRKLGEKYGEKISDPRQLLCLGKPMMNRNPYYSEENISSCKNVIDSGCGVGTDLRYLRKNGIRAFGVDKCIDTIKLGIEFYGDDAESGNFIIDGDVTDLPFAGGKFDLYHSGSVTHMLGSASGVNAQFREAGRLLVPGGEIIGRVLGGEKKDDMYLMNQSELTEILKNSGFDDISVSEVNLKPCKIRRMFDQLREVIPEIFNIRYKDGIPMFDYMIFYHARKAG